MIKSRDQGRNSLKIMDSLSFDAVYYNTNCRSRYILQLMYIIPLFRKFRKFAKKFKIILIVKINTNRLYPIEESCIISKFYSYYILFQYFRI